MSHLGSANKIHMEYHFTPTRMAIKKQNKPPTKKTQKIISLGKVVEKLESLYIAGETVK